MTKSLSALLFLLVAASSCGSEKIGGVIDAAPAIDSSIGVADAAVADVAVPDVAIADAVFQDVAPHFDATPPVPDARICNTGGYPPAVRFVEVDLGAEYALTLDGQGTRCEQIVRALTSAQRPPELTQLDTAGGGITGTCSFDDLLMRDIVRLRAPNYAGLPVFQPVQDVLAHVSQDNKVVFLHGNFLTAGATVAAACFSGAELLASVPGRPLGYGKFRSCQFQGPGEYTIAADDDLELGAEGWFLDEEGKLHRARAVEVYLDPSHVNDEIINSDAFCCTGGLDHCVGARMLIDSLTGELLGQQTHCHTC